jgi:hypothetical protein
MRHAPVPIRGLLHISGLPLTFVAIALYSGNSATFAAFFCAKRFLSQGAVK